MHIAVFSDLHLDVNKDYPFTFTNRSGIDAVAIAGDISGDPSTTTKFLDDSFPEDGNGPEVVFVSGNHDVYNHLDLPLEDLKKKLHEKFTVDSRVTYMDESVGVVSKKIGDVLFVGSCLYTDYKLPCELHRQDMTPQEYNMMVAVPRMSGGGLNDFNWGLVKEGTYKKDKGSFFDRSKYYRLRPKNYLLYHKRTMRAFKKVVESNPNEKVVLLTHHCMTPKCIHASYVDSYMNASYVSDLEKFITSHPNIKAVFSGHVHHRMEDHIGNCLVLTNPRGYCHHGEDRDFTIGKTGGGDWTPYCIVDTEDWTVERIPYTDKVWERQHKKDDAAYKRALAMFG